MLQGVAHTASSHLAPVQPLEQVQVSGDVHSPFAPHGVVQMATSHSGPFQPLAHVHEFGAEHVP